MYKKTLQFVLSASIAIVTLCVFSMQQYDQVQRMVALEKQANPPAITPTIAQSNPEEETVEQPEQPESTIPQAPKATPPNKPAPEVQQLLDKIEYDQPVEEVPYYTLATPNDPIYPQWYSTVIDAPDAWDITTGSSESSVAVIDTGYALGHEDLSDAWLINDGEQGMTQAGDLCWQGSPEDKQTNNCDDDDNGLVDDWRGWDFANNDNNPQAGDNDVNGATHGTKVAGLVGARSNNGTGVASINWNTNILPLQGLYDEGVGYSSDIAGAIIYATGRGVDVINLSLGGATPDSLILAAIRYADSNNVVVVAASGNCGDEQESDQCLGYPSPGGMSYPARYNEVISVGATNSTDTVASFSSWGAELDFVAPGSGSIRTPTWSSLDETSLYAGTSYGTSFAAPIVSGLAGLVKSEFPELDTVEVYGLLQQAADKPAGMNGNNFTQLYGFGRINAHQTLLEIDEYTEDIQKSGGIRGSSPQESEQVPLITTNTGHIQNTSIGSNTNAATYCVSTPSTLCTLSFNKTGSSTVSFETKRTNAQGIAIWYWNSTDIDVSGTWTATTVSNGKTSASETLFID